jgi:c-di-GMP-binding flagellar brake protein YcgR
MGLSATERRWKRMKVDMRVKLRRGDAMEDSATVVRTYEMSEGGMSVYSPDGLEIGATVMVSFSLPGMDMPLQLRAVVRNRRGFRWGMEFVEIGPGERSEVARYLGTLPEASGSATPAPGDSAT